MPHKSCDYVPFIPPHFNFEAPAKKINVLNKYSEILKDAHVHSYATLLKQYSDSRCPNNATTVHTHKKRTKGLLEILSQLSQKWSNQGQLHLIIDTWRCFTSHPRGFISSDWLVGSSRCLTSVGSLSRPLMSHGLLVLLADNSLWSFWSNMRPSEIGC